MAFLDDLGKKISDASQSTIQKTKDMADTAKLSSLISEEEKSIRANYTIIGEICYNAMKDNPEPDYAQYVSLITESKNKIEDYQNKIDEMKRRGKCTNCGATIALDDTFCAACGQKIIKEEPVVETAENVCPQCGKALTEGAAFCIYCGNKI